MGNSSSSSSKQKSLNRNSSRTASSGGPSGSGALKTQSSKATIWLKLSSPGQKLKIRTTANVEGECVGYLRNNDEIEVCVKVVSGFFELANGRVNLI
jgi:hypothetical protein